MLIEPHYRTLKGFHALILKEWLYFRHSFRKYLNLENDESLDSTFCPLFILLLDCIYQLYVQNPLSFEFSISFLTDLAHNSMLNKYFEFTSSSSSSDDHQQQLLSAFLHPLHSS
jgi:hypothetical protein